MNPEPLISVIMPVYNSEKYVAEAIQGVLDQTHKNIELICINDGSTDGSIDILKSFGDKLILIDNNENGGIGKARNLGIDKSSGEFIAFMDSDDIWKFTKLEAQILHFKNNPNIDICFTYMKCFVSPELSDEIKKIRHCPPDPIPGNLACSALIRTASFYKVGLFNEKWKMGEFIDWFAKAKEMNLRYEVISDVCLFRRIHNTNTGVTRRESRNDYIKIIRESLKRRK